MKYYIFIAITLMLGCATKQPSINYCSWSQDSTRWTSGDPNWQNAFVASLFEQKDNALQEITGGFVKRSRVYDNEGHVVEVVENSRGIVSVEDFTSRCYLTPNAYFARQVGVYNYQDLVRMKVK